MVTNVFRPLTSDFRLPTSEHRSFPRNLLFAEALYLVRYIERYGTGTGDMIRLCRKAGLPEPDFRLTDGFVTIIQRPVRMKSTPATAQDTAQVTPQVTPQDNSMAFSALHDLASILGTTTPQVTPQVAAQVTAVLKASRVESSREILQGAADIRDREHFRKAYIETLLAAGLIERTIPEKPTSRLQKYRLTDKGRALLKELTP